MEDPKHNEGQELEQNVSPSPEEAEEQKSGRAGEGPEEDGPASKEEEYLAGWKRAQADYANLKREAEKMRADYAKYAAADIVERLLPILDNLRAATAQLPDTGENAQVTAWVTGIGHIRTQFENVLKDAGVLPIDATDVPFDPSIHEALMRETKDGADPDTVLKIVEAGYKLHDKVLRPAKVIVSE